jgi:hypothetical protein
MELPAPHIFLETAPTKGESTPRKLATAAQPKFPRIVADFKQASYLQISRRILKKLMSE